MMTVVAAVTGDAMPRLADQSTGLTELQFFVKTAPPRPALTLTLEPVWGPCAAWIRV